MVLDKSQCTIVYLGNCKRPHLPLDDDDDNDWPTKRNILRNINLTCIDIGFTITVGVCLRWRENPFPLMVFSLVAIRLKHYTIHSREDSLPTTTDMMTSLCKLVYERTKCILYYGLADPYNSSCMNTINAFCDQLYLSGCLYLLIQQNHKLIVNDSKYTLITLATYWGIKELLQLVVQPHLDGQPLPDQAHLVRSIFGGEEFLPPLLHLALVAEVDPQSCPVRRPFVQCFHAAVHVVLIGLLVCLRRWWPENWFWLTPFREGWCKLYSATVESLRLRLRWWGGRQIGTTTVAEVVQFIVVGCCSPAISVTFLWLLGLFAPFFYLSHDGGQQQFMAITWMDEWKWEKWTALGFTRGESTGSLEMQMKHLIRLVSSVMILLFPPPPLFC